MVKFLTFPQTVQAKVKTKAIKKAMEQSLRGNGRDQYIEQYVDGHSIGAAQERERWRKLSEHPRFLEHRAFAVELYSRTGDFDATLAALDVDASSARPS